MSPISWAKRFGGPATSRGSTLSRGTIKNYRQRLYDKLDITTEREIFLAFIAATKQR